MSTQQTASDEIDRAPKYESESETRSSLRDMGALLALPALWVDHEPGEIVAGLLSVLFGVLRLDGAYARVNDPDGGEPLETWRPSGAAMPAELLVALETGRKPQSATATKTIGHMRVTSAPLALPWESGLVLISASRESFPTPVETQLLRMAIGQGAIAIHAARRLARERIARVAAEDALRRQNELLRSLAQDVEPSLASMLRRVHEAVLVVATVDKSYRARPSSNGAAADSETFEPTPPADSALPTLTRREAEVLGLLAQGLSNREIAGIIWLSDRTVERHLSSAYRKIGVTRRSEATAFALRHGVV